MHTPAIRTFQILAVFAYGAISFLVYRQMMGMSADALIYLNLLAQVALIIMGVLLSLRDAWPKEHPWIVVAAFALAGGVAMFAAVRQNQLPAKEAAEAQRQVTDAQKQTAEATAKLSDSMNRLGTQTGEISRVQGLNTELQSKLIGQGGQLLSSSERISELSKQAIDTTTGGASFCYMTLDPQLTPQGVMMTPVVIHKGQQPLYSLEARIANLQKLDDVMKRSRYSREAFDSANVNIEIGELSPVTAYLSGRTFVLNDSVRYDFRIFFRGRNGYWDQDLQLRKVGNNWAQAIRVYRSVGKKKVKLFEQIPKDFFPKQKPDWHN